MIGCTPRRRDAGILTIVNPSSGSIAKSASHRINYRAQGTSKLAFPALFKIDS